MEQFSDGIFTVFTYTILPSWKEGNFTSFSFGEILFSFSYLIVPAKTVGTLLSSRSEHMSSSLLPDLRGKAFSLSPLSMILAVLFCICHLLCCDNLLFLVCVYVFFFFCLFVFFFVFSRAAPTAYGGSQARSRIRAVAASLHHSHSNAGSRAPSVTYTATPDP